MFVRSMHFRYDSVLRISSVRGVMEDGNVLAVVTDLYSTIQYSNLRNDGKAEAEIVAHSHSRMAAEVIQMALKLKERNEASI